MLCIAQNSRSREIAAAAHIVALGWCATFVWHYLFYGTGETWGHAIIDGAMASYFWRLSKIRIFALPLFYIHVCFVGVNLFTTLAQADDWWFAFMSNRLFEFELVYILGCSAYRTRKLRNMKKGALLERPDAMRGNKVLIEKFRPAARLALLPASAVPRVRDDQRRDARRFGEDHLFVDRRHLAPARRFFQR